MVAPSSMAARMSVYVLTASSSRYPTNLRRVGEMHEGRRHGWREARQNHDIPMADLGIDEVGEEEEIHENTL
jgi:hypothetical protein